MIRIGIIGCGTVSRRMALPAFRQIKSVKVVAGADRNLDTARKLASDFNIPNIYTDYRQLLRRSDIDAVYIATPNNLHARMTVAASRARKHILVEKPMCTSMKEAHQMIEVARKNKVILMVEQVHRYTPISQTARRVIKSGRLGKIFAARAHIGSPGPEHWAPEAKWFFEKSPTAGGALIDIGIHALDLLRYLIRKEVTSVSAITWTIRKRITVEDNAAFLMMFSHGAGGALEATWCQFPGEFSWMVYGEKGYLEMKNGSLFLHLGGRPYSKRTTRLRLVKRSPTGNAFEHFVRCVRRGIKPISDGEDAAKSLEVILAAYKSARTGKSAKLPIND